MPSGKLATIQSLRALAITFVLFYHLNAKWVPRGFLGVDMFFVISGYLMAKIFYDKGTSCSQAYEFYKRRFRRIMPCYGLTIAIVVWFGRMKLVDVDRDNLFTDALLSLGIVSNMQPFYTKFDYWQMISEYKFLTHTWSLALSVNGLIVLPPSQSFGFVFCRLWQFIAGIGVHLIFIASDEKNMIGGYKRMQIEEADGLLGDQENALKSGDDVEIKDNQPCHSKFPHIAVGLFLLNIGLGFFESLPIYLSRLLSVLATAGIIYLTQIEESPLLTVQPMPYIGDVSYILYLVHWPVITFYKVLNNAELTIYDVGVMFVLSVLISLAAHHFIENHFLGQGAYLCLPFTVFCYLMAISGVFLPIQKPLEIDSVPMMLINQTKDCTALLKLPEMPDFKNWSAEGAYYEHYGELHGNGSFDVMVVGNSYVQHYRNWPDKIFQKRYRKYYHHDISTCVPFLDYRGLHVLGGVCEKYFQRVIKNIEEVKPKIVFFILGYGKANDLIMVNFKKMYPPAIERIKRIAASTEHLLITYPMFYLDDDRAHKNERIFRKGDPLPPRNRSQFTYSDYLKQCGHTLTLLFRATENCPMCRLVDTQSLFCEDGIHCDVFDYDCGKNLYDWGGRHPSVFARNRQQAVYQMVIDQVYSQIADDELTKK
ncbi:unnamed protein product, partial [Mesorhabditis belari]|uniref:Acyl_transf_3 domain-containing protein n=1 Tax=Mesorhabditis belari TaxID=2138241 RepID=A0AAF3JB78_9BILA